MSFDLLRLETRSTRSTFNTTLFSRVIRNFCGSALFGLEVILLSLHQSVKLFHSSVTSIVIISFILSPLDFRQQLRIALLVRPKSGRGISYISAFLVSHKHIYIHLHLRHSFRYLVLLFLLVFRCFNVLVR
jgi:hypothetical protein